ncbi:hypothetical protein JCM8097_009197 [Rhodosporidiobolus ruineniae]
MGGSLYTAEQVTGWIGTVLWCIQLVPQVWLNYRRKTTQGLSPLLFICWMVSGATLGIYAIVQDISIPIIVQPHCYGALCAFIICQILHYDRKWRWYASYLGGFATYAVVCAGFEVGMVYACRAGEARGNSAGTKVFGVVNVIALAAGFFPQFWEIYKLKEVVGISYAFLFMDSLGAVFSIVSLACKTEESIDVLALVGYIVVLAFEILIGIVAAIINPMAQRRRDALAAEEKADATAERDLASSTTMTSTAPTLAGDLEAQTTEKQQRARAEEEEREREREVEAAERYLPEVVPEEEQRRADDHV